MKDVNKVILVGRLGANPVQRETKNGTSVVHFPMATSRRVMAPVKAPVNTEDVEGGATEETQWHRIVVWGKQGESCAQHLRKGQPVYVEGSLRSHKYGENGERISFEVHAENVSFLGARPRASSENELPLVANG